MLHTCGDRMQLSLLFASYRLNVHCYLNHLQWFVNSISISNEIPYFVFTLQFPLNVNQSYYAGGHMCCLLCLISADKCQGAELGSFSKYINLDDWWKNWLEVHVLYKNASLLTFLSTQIEPIFSLIVKTRCQPSLS